MKDALMLRKGGENVKAEVEQQVGIIDALEALAMITGKPKGKYLWLKLQADNDAFMEACVSDEATTYPDNAVADDGYYYMRVTEVLGTDKNGTFIFSL